MTAGSISDSSTTDEKSSPVNGVAPVTNNEHKIRLAEKENRAVIRLKVFMMLTLAAAATILGLVTFLLTSRGEENSFRSEFENFATELIEVSHEESANAFGIMKTLSVDATSLALYKKNTTWPNFSVPHLAQRMAKSRELSQATLIALSPVVEQDKRTEWEVYASSAQDWTNKGLVTQGEKPTLSRIPLFIHSRVGDERTPQSATGPFSPLWQMSPAPKDKSIVNYDLFESDAVKSLAKFVDIHRRAGLSRVIDMTTLFGSSVAHLGENPESLLLQPIFEDFNEDSKIVAHFAAVLEWDVYFKNILHQGADGIVIVVEDTCSEKFSFEINGPNVTYLGDGDYHDMEYDDMVRMTEFSILKHIDEDRGDDDGEACDYFLRIYPSDKFHGSYTTNAAAIYTAAVVLIFIVTSLVFVFHNTLVEQRQNKVMNTANRTNEIVASLFPENVRDQILAGSDTDDVKGKGKAPGGKQGLKTFLEKGAAGDDNVHAYGDSKPIADFFPHTTIMFADINGFTAWSSVREPTQVFTLLETIFHAFDQIAKKRGVFKVETVGDCYVAVTGLPEPNKEHAVVMAKFARDCMAEMRVLVHKLEVTLGPDTADLAIRVGMHSGPVTAGVLRGERARFQLFGDTMNTAARMETTGQRNKIHISEETADLLTEAKKENWFQLREDVVVAKGKGALQTFWLTPKHECRPKDQASNSEVGEATTALDQNEVELVGEALLAKRTAAGMKAQRLIDWNSELLLQLLKKIVARRNVTKMKSVSPILAARIEALEMQIGNAGTVLEEVCEIITLPSFDAKVAKDEANSETIELGENVQSQLRDFVAILASMYRDNPFHCFEHASHVTMSVSKLLSRIAAPDAVTPGSTKHSEEDNLAWALHDHTYGITSDPLTQFSVVMSALIHDVDHRGVPNFILCKEDPNLAAVYREKSVAEQNSVDLAWSALLDPSFDDLRRCIYGDESEMKRFRQLLVNSVIATDIFDKELGILRKKRWVKAFQEGPEEGSQMEDINRKATIVIEHLIQASDVSHTMQHWHVYQKWNFRLFQEMYSAFLHGRSDTDPSEGWYRGEIGFFDNFVIPLGRKLKECGVFGVSSDEYLSYAIDNRRQWEAKGFEIVNSMVEKCHVEHLEDAVNSGMRIVDPAAKTMGAMQA